MSLSARPSKTACELYRDFYAKQFRRGAVGSSVDAPLLSTCASGGLVTSLLAERLEGGLSSGALVAGLAYDGEDAPRPCTRLARTMDELYASAGSVYTDFDHVGQLLRILEEEEGVFDIVALPCQLSRLRSVLSRREDLSARAGLLIGLWCGHATGPELLGTMLRKWEIAPDDVADLRYRQGHWRGRTRITLRDGTILEKSFSRGFGIYQNMYSDCALRCLSCMDHFGESADISFGDCWLGSEKKAEHKKTMALSITEPGDEALEMILSSRSCSASQVDPVLAVEAQKRSVIWHTYSCAARSRMGKLFRMNVSCASDLTPRWNDYLSGFLTLLYCRMFDSGLRGILFRLPWWVLFPFMAFQKLMLNR